MEDISHPVIKAAIATGSFVSLTWIDWLTNAGKVCAALTAIAIFSEWLWKRLLRPVLRELKALNPPFDDTDMP